MVEPPTSDATSADTAPDGIERVAIQQIVADHHRPLYRYAFRLSGSQADAEDLTQQTFVVAQQKLDQLRDPTKVRSWLYTVLRNCYLKSKRKRTPQSAADLDLNIDAVAQPLPEAETIDRQQLQAALDDLPDEYKLVVTMFYFQECSYKDIAAELDIPLGTVMSRLARAKGRLRRALLPQRDEHGPHKAIAPKSIASNAGKDASPTHRPSKRP